MDSRRHTIPVGAMAGRSGAEMAMTARDTSVWRPSSTSAVGRCLTPAFVLSVTTIALCTVEGTYLGLAGFVPLAFLFCGARALLWKRGVGRNEIAFTQRQLSCGRAGKRTSVPTTNILRVEWVPGDRWPEFSQFAIFGHPVVYTLDHQYIEMPPILDVSHRDREGVISFMRDRADALEIELVVHESR